MTKAITVVAEAAAEPNNEHEDEYDHEMILSDMELPFR